MSTHPESSRILRVILVIVGLLLAVFIVCEIMGWPFLRQPLQNVMSRQLDRDVRIAAPFSLHLLGGIKLNVGGLRIAAPGGFDAPYLLDAQNAKLALRYSDLIGWDSATEPLHIKLLQVGKMDAYMLRNKQGATWQFKKEQPEQKPTPFPIFETLVVKDGSAVVQDTVTDADVEMSFHTREGSGDRDAVSVVEAEGTFRQHPIRGRLVTPGFLPAATEHDDRPIPLDVWADYGGVRVDFKGDIADISTDKKIRGNFTIKGPSLGIAGDLFNITLPTTTEFVIKGDIRRENELLLVDIDSAHVGSSDLSGKFKFDTSGERIVMKGDLNSSNFVLADLAPTFGTRAENGTEVPSRDGYIFPDRPLNLPALNKFNADLVLNFKRVDLGKAFREPIAPFKASLSLNSGKLSLAKIDARTADGSLAGTIAVDAHALGASGNPDPRDKSRPKPEWFLNLKWADINLAKWLQKRDSKKPDEPAAYITGILNGKADLKGRGNSTSELLGSIDGDIAASINNGKISHLVIETLGIDVAQALGLVIEGDELLPMQCAVVDMKSTQGVLRPDVAVIDTPVTLVLMDGKINLQKEQLDLRFVAKPENASPFTARSPILITGTLADPNVKPKAAPIAARVVGGIALAFINPLAAIIPFLDPGSGEHDPCGQALRRFNAAKAKNAKAARPDAKVSDKPAEGSSGGRASVESSDRVKPTTAALQPNQSAEPKSKQSEPIANPPYGTRGIPGHGVD
ncbi:MAG TPA: AsmA family protein [Methylophilaceae bacterium]|nr:AsmA family protein [Methylophilaceae bacterium]